MDIYLYISLSIALSSLSESHDTKWVVFRRIYEERSREVKYQDEENSGRGIKKARVALKLKVSELSFEEVAHAVLSNHWEDDFIDELFREGKERSVQILNAIVDVLLDSICTNRNACDGLSLTPLFDEALLKFMSRLVPFYSSLDPGDVDNTDNSNTAYSSSDEAAMVGDVYAMLPVTLLEASHARLADIPPAAFQTMLR